jgi:hypothetical protein
MLALLRGQAGSLTHRACVARGRTQVYADKGKRRGRSNTPASKQAQCVAHAYDARALSVHACRHSVLPLVLSLVLWRMLSFIVIQTRAWRACGPKLSC